MTTETPNTSGLSLTYTVPRHLSFAYVNADGALRGHSTHVTVELMAADNAFELAQPLQHGPGVVADFGYVRHGVAQCIECLDHTLLCAKDHLTEHGELGDGTSLPDYWLEVSTPLFTAVLPVDGVVAVTPAYGQGFSDEHIFQLVCNHLERQIQRLCDDRKWPITNVTVTFDNRAHGRPIGAPLASLLRQNKPSWLTPMTFSYVHGLSDSCALGCQLIAHGHRNVLQVEVMIGSDPAKRSGVNDLLLDIQDALDGTYLADDRQLASFHQIAYTSRNRGHQQLLFTGNLQQHPVVKLQGAPTCENLALYIKDRWGDQMRRCNVTRFYLSEGLDKGVTITL